MALKTRQLDFSPLDSRSYIYDERARREQLLAGVAQSVSKHLNEVGERKRAERLQKQSDIAEGMSFDPAITGNLIINNALTDDWIKNVRDPWIHEMQKKKGPITAMDKATLAAQKQAFLKKANASKNFVKTVEDARVNSLKKENRGLYDFDSDEVQRIYQDISTGDISVDDLVMTNLYENYDSGMPFTSLVEQDPEHLFRTGIDTYKRSTAKPGPEIIETVEKDGKTRTTATQETSYGDVEQFADEWISGFKTRSDQANYIKKVNKDLTDQEKQEAVKLYPAEDIEDSLLNYYVRNKKRGDIEKELQSDVDKRQVTKPETGKGKGITFMFGGRKPSGPDDFVPQDDKVEGVNMPEYFEFAKAGKHKNVKGVTVKGAALIPEGAETPEEPADITTPSDFEVIGYSGGKDQIALRKLAVRKGGVAYYETYVAPREGNEHFLKDLVTSETLNEMASRNEAEYDVPGYGPYTRSYLLDMGYPAEEIEKFKRVE